MHGTKPRCRCGIPILYYDELSSQSRSCYMLIKLLDIDVELQAINFFNGKHINDSHRKINPNTTPTLIDGQYVISDGHSIMIYLCDKYAGVNLPHLCPCDYLPRLNVLNMLFYENCVLHRRYSQLVSEILLKKYPNLNMDYHQAKVQDSYNYLENNLKGQLCLTGNCITIADLSVVTTLSSLNIIFPISVYKWPNLLRWFENVKNMDFYKCNDRGIQKLSHLLATEGQFPLTSRPTLEAAQGQLSSSLQPSGDLDKKPVNSLKSKENAVLAGNERKYLSEIQLESTYKGVTISEDQTEQIKFSKFFPKVRTSKIINSPLHSKNNEAESSIQRKEFYKKMTGLRRNGRTKESEIACNGVTTSAPSEDQNVDLEFSKFFPKVRTSKIIDSTYHEAEASSPDGKLYEKTASKVLQDNEVACGVENCQPERNIGPYKASYCLCCGRSYISNKSHMDMNQRGQMNECNHKEKRDLQMTGPTHYCDSVEPTLKYTTDDQCPCCSGYRQTESCSNDNKVDRRGYRSCRVCMANCDNCGPACPCTTRMTARQRETCSDMEDLCTHEYEYEYNRNARDDDAANRECCCNCHDDISDEECECYEEDNCKCDDDAMVFLLS